jgi:hypothetical protein
MNRAVHFVGFRTGSQFQSAVRVWGQPDFTHVTWDNRCAFGGEVDWDNDVVVFAQGTDQDTPCPYSFNDSDVDCQAFDRSH